MAVLFSAVTLSANDQEVEFFVGGIPSEYDDLEGRTAFENFMEDIDEETEVSVHAEVYLYGEAESYKATPEEVACRANLGMAVTLMTLPPACFPTTEQVANSVLTFCRLYCIIKLK